MEIGSPELMKASAAAVYKVPKTLEEMDAFFKDESKTKFIGSADREKVSNLYRNFAMGAVEHEYEALPKDWHVKGTKWKATVLERFATLLKWLEIRPERRIAIVGASRLASPRIQTRTPLRPMRTVPHL